MCHLEDFSFYFEQSTAKNIGSIYVPVDRVTSAEKFSPQVSVCEAGNWFKKGPVNK